MFKFCNALPETKLKKADKTLRVRSTDWKSSLILGLERFYMLCRF